MRTVNHLQALVSGWQTANTVENESLLKTDTNKCVGNKTVTVNEIKEAICNLFNFSVQEETDQKIVFNVIADTLTTLDKEQVEQIILEIGRMTADQEIELFNNHNYEVLVRNENRVMFSRDINQTDNVNKIEYKIDRPTDNYLIFFLYNLAKQNTPRILRGGIMPHRLRRIYDNQQTSL